ncbi:MAG: thrombospondin type 3 repeat-containing protein [Deltaproteobacteria bacterium]|nr:thrombospondin type 3 repeat-containing protein [Deltaproteobacteria bacterium]
MRCLDPGPRLAAAACSVAIAVLVLDACSFDATGIGPGISGPLPDAAADGLLMMEARTEGQIVDASIDSDLLRPPTDGPAADQLLPDLTPSSDQLPLDAPRPDTDGDGVPDVSDNCPTKANTGQADVDGDKVGDACDNCPKLANMGQTDLDSDALGDACDSDMDDDSLPNDIDPNPDSKDTVHYYKAPLGTAMGDFTFEGPWSAGSGGALCHTSTATSYDWTRLESSELSATDYLVQTRFTFVSHSTSGGWPAAGLAFRNKSIDPPSNYICVVDTENRRVVLGRFNSGDWNEYAASSSGSVSNAVAYTVRAIAEGNSLTCQVVGGPSVTYSSSLHDSGTVGLFTYEVNACFDYLFVTAAP